MLQNTICAVATPQGEGGVGVVRISGDEALQILQRVFAPIGKVGGEEFMPKPRYMHFGNALDAEGRILDEVLAVYMPSPHSYTGEDVVEIQCHGGYVVTKEIIKSLLAAGAVMAEPGEFTQRAFVNGRLNLTQAEAVIDIIQAKSAEALQISEKQLSGRLGQTVLAANDKLLDILAQIEVAVDYPEEEEDIWRQLNLENRLGEVLRTVRSLLKTADDGKMYRDGLLTAIVGPANAGKSTLLNALLCEERAIVTDIAGTTRDTVEEYFNIKGVPIRLADTAGIRETDDPVEAFGVRKSLQKMAEAGLVLLVWDITCPLDEEWRQKIAEMSGKPLLFLLNKTDLAAADEVNEFKGQIAELFPQTAVLELSAKNGGGLEELKDKIYQMAVAGKVDRNSMVGLVNGRQKSALLRAEKHLQEALAAYAAGIEGSMLSVDIQGAWEALAEITGGVTSDDIIDRVFSRFCLGK